MSTTADFIDTTELARPWPRFWARLVDVQLYSLPVALAIGVLFPSLFLSDAFEGRGGDMLAGFICLPFALVIDAVILSQTGSSLGKGLAGIFLARTEGGRAPVGLALERNFRLYFVGLVLGLPLICLIGYSNAYSDMKDGGTTTWDRATETRVYSSTDNGLRTWLVGALAIVLLVAGQALSRMADNGSL